MPDTATGQEIVSSVVLPPSEQPIPISVIRHLGLDYSGLAYKDAVPGEASHFNPLQAQSLRAGLLDGISQIVSAPTGAGKSVIGEIACARAIIEGKPSIWTVPMKALAEERAGALRALFPGKTVTCITGDYKLTEVRKRAMEAADIVVCTVEMALHRLTNAATEGTTVFGRAGAIVVDEVHVIGDENRGHAVEMAIMGCAAANPGAQYVLMSATMGALTELQTWMASITGRPCAIVETTWRPTVLHTHVSRHPEPNWGIDGKYALARNILARHPGAKTIIFCPSRNESRAMAVQLKKDGFAAECHNAGLAMNDRSAIETRFKDGDLQIICCTPTLALGINTPASVVIVAGTMRGMTPITGLEIAQQIGRAGRPKYDVEGWGYVLASPRDGRNTAEILRIPDVSSSIGNEEALEFYILQLIHNGIVKTLGDLESWWKRTFAHHISTMGVNLRRPVAWLTMNGFVERTAINAPYIVTHLGRACVFFYMHPRDVKAWKDQFGLVNDRHAWSSDMACSWAWVSRGQRAAANYVTKEDTELNRKWITGNAMDVIDIIALHDPQKADEILIKMVAESLMDEAPDQPITARYFHDDVHIKFARINHGCFTADRDDPMAALVRVDIGRKAECLKYIAGCLRWNANDEIDAMRLRMEYGIPPEAADLVRLDGVGRTRALRLLHAGIKTRKDIAARADDVRKLFPGKVGENVVRAAVRYQWPKM